jgi:hypothetical protein
VSATIIGMLVEIRDNFIVLSGLTYIMLPPGMKVENLVVGEALTVTVTSRSTSALERNAPNPSTHSF